MTGSNRLLLGFGWPLVVIVALAVANRAAKRKKAARVSYLQLPEESRLDVGFLAVLAVVAFAIPFLGHIPSGSASCSSPRSRSTSGAPARPRTTKRSTSSVPRR